MMAAYSIRSQVQTQAALSGVCMSCLSLHRLIPGAQISAAIKIVIAILVLETKLNQNLWILGQKTKGGFAGRKNLSMLH